MLGKTLNFFKAVGESVRYAYHNPVAAFRSAIGSSRDEMVELNKVGLGINHKGEIIDLPDPAPKPRRSRSPY